MAMIDTRKIVCGLLIGTLLLSVATPAPVHAQTHEESSLWESIKDSKDADDYKGYLDKYPDGIYAPLAKRRIAHLEAHPSEALGAQPANTTDVGTVQSTSKQRSGAPVVMTECEGTNNCATWTFLGTQGNGQWPSGDTANLSVEHFDADSVVIRRADSTGSSAGLTALYKGTRHGDRVGGDFTSSWPGHWENKAGNWYATIGKADQNPPPVMRVCEIGHSCSTWVWNGDHYDGSWSNATAVMKVVSFSPESVTIKRTDTGGRPGYYAYVYTGKISSQGNSILNGEQVGEPGSAEAEHIARFNATWGSAINQNSAGPANPATVYRPTVCYSWFFTLVCQ